MTSRPAITKGCRQRCVFLTHPGAAFSLNRKPRTHADGHVEGYWACDAYLDVNSRVLEAMIASAL